MPSMSDPTVPNVLKHAMAEARLADLERRFADEMERTEAVGPAWLGDAAVPNAEARPSVVVCGAGLSGLAIAFGLKRRGVADVLVIDRATAGQEGPWLTCARMPTLRSPKHLAGPDLGIPSLTMRSWYEAVHGEQAWQDLQRIGRVDWMDYLVWFRRVTGIAVANDRRLAHIRPDRDGLQLTVDRIGMGEEAIACRRLVLATGIEGCGGPAIPPELAALPRERWTHSSEAFEPADLCGKRVAVVGGSTSSFDWAVAALDAGAASVTLLVRSAKLPMTEVLAWSNFPGFLGHFADLPDAERWRFMRRFFAFKVPPTQDQYDRAVADPRTSIHFDSPCTAITLAAGAIRIVTPNGPVVADHLLLGTGFTVDVRRRPELASLQGHVALWRDVFTPAAGEASEELGAHPYLGPGFELMPADPGQDGWVSRVHLFNNGAIPSLGPICNGVTGLKYGVPRIVAGLAKNLFLEDATRHFTALSAYAAVHFDARPPQERAGFAKAEA